MTVKWLSNLNQSEHEKKNPVKSQSLHKETIWELG